MILFYSKSFNLERSTSRSDIKNFVALPGNCQHASKGAPGQPVPDLWAAAVKTKTTLKIDTDMKKFLRLFSRRSLNEGESAARGGVAIRPDRLLYAVGDIHGRIDLLERLLPRIEADADGRAHDLVFVGDYVDRGDDSAAVLSRLQQLEDAAHVTCLSGNHEQMLLGFLDDPAKNGRRWLRNGGLQTLASFGVGGVHETAAPEQMEKASRALKDALGPLQAWLRARPLSFASGNVLVVHAGVDPDRPLDAQEDKTLLWGHPKFLSSVRTDGHWVVHGHTIHDAAAAVDGRIAVDTGAYATGRLTAAAIGETELTFLDTL